MTFDPTSKNIILISYPPGGFGNFVYHTLTNFADNTVKVDQNFAFSKDGNSHSTNIYTTCYDPNIPNYNAHITVDPADKKILVMCSDRYDDIPLLFPNATIVRLCIDHDAKPIVFNTCVTKAQSSTLYENSANSLMHWEHPTEDYSIRENFTLLFHNWPLHWNPVLTNTMNIINIPISELVIFPVNTITKLINSLKMEVINIDELTSLTTQWRLSNQNYFKILTIKSEIINALKNKNTINLTHVTDLYTQGYINYCIEEIYNVNIPVYDYRNWFKNSSEILDFIDSTMARN